MMQIKIMMISKRIIKRNLLISLVSIVSIYLLISLYFINHFLFHTEINGIDVSLKAHDDFSYIIDDFLRDYELRLLERGGETEVISGPEIGMHYNNSNIASLVVNHMQNPFLWIGSLFKSNRYYMKELYDFDKTLLVNKINSFQCISGKIIAPKNVDFKYSNGSYEIIKEIDGNKINTAHFVEIVNKYISMGRPKLDLNKTSCYENPKYTISSKKTHKTKNLLNRYVSARITYRFGSITEQLDGATIHQWLIIDENLDIIINKEKVKDYIDALSKKYDTVGISREFQSTTGKKIDLKGGLYGWKINRDAEVEAILINIKKADVIEKEPVYLQRAFSREGNEIGNTYIEINISKQHLWFYKDGKLIVQGSVVTGNPNRGNATVLGVYMINYKQKEAILTGPGYEVKVTYWMPFFGNMGLHDASWRYRFGREIYLRNGTHGCVNAPLYLAKTIFEHIEAGTPVIIYEE